MSLFKHCVILRLLQFSWNMFSLYLHRILEKEISSSPSAHPSNLPSVSKVPTIAPTPVPTLSPTLNPTTQAPSSRPSVFTPSTSTDDGVLGPTPSPVPRKPVVVPSRNPPPILGSILGSGRPPPLLPTEPKHSQNEYDTAPDFADLDDFFERKPFHDLEDILEDYSVIISYSGSRYYGTIVESNATLGDLFPRDYHAFWSQSFDVNRTFIISQTTFSGSPEPVGIDFFEMRRRIDTVLNQNVNFSYGPYGARIPLMSYQ